jgi:hypothetical protein
MNVHFYTPANRDGWQSATAWIVLTRVDSPSGALCRPSYLDYSGVTAATLSVDEAPDSRFKLFVDKLRGTLFSNDLVVSETGSEMGLPLSESPG